MSRYRNLTFDGMNFSDGRCIYWCIQDRTPQLFDDATETFHPMTMAHRRAIFSDEDVTLVLHFPFGIRRVFGIEGPVDLKKLLKVFRFAFRQRVTAVDARKAGIPNLSEQRRISHKSGSIYKYHRYRPLFSDSVCFQGVVREGMCCNAYFD